ncbi:AAA family ATPase, partial [Extibacter muris]|uniref:AAA family ATPase n=1 Tax=Extibacter muris TaxID=1796622 RepID=UPI001D096DA9
MKDEGDGFRSFVSVYLALRSGDKPVVLIDEPESFLHPPQAYELGKVIGSSAEQCSQMIIATHSTHLLNGIMSTCDWDNCDILRLQRDGDSLRANLLDREGLDRVKGDPLLRSTRLLEGVFTRVVVVVESESDALVYREILNKV